MHRLLFVFTTLLALVGCQSTRLPEPIAVGFTAAQVRSSLGQPFQVSRQGSEETWLYRDWPRDPNDRIRAGYRRRVEFDPVRRSNVITYEAVDDRLFPSLRTRTLRITFRDAHVAAIDSIEDL